MTNNLGLHNLLLSDVDTVGRIEKDPRGALDGTTAIRGTGRSISHTPDILSPKSKSTPHMLGIKSKVSYMFCKYSSTWPLFKFFSTCGDT